MFLKIIREIFAVIELACGEYGKDKIETLVKGCENGNSLKWFSNPELLMQKPKGTFKKLDFKLPLHFTIKIFQNFSQNDEKRLSREHKEPSTNVAGEPNNRSN